MYSSFYLRGPNGNFIRSIISAIDQSRVADGGKLSRLNDFCVNINIDNVERVYFKCAVIPLCLFESWTRPCKKSKAVTSAFSPALGVPL